MFSLITASSTPLLGSRISQWNTALPQFANRFSNDHLDISVAVYDVNTPFTTVLDNPQKYGFKDAVSICHTSECIWADIVHSTFAMHKILALNIARFLENPSATE
jgi:phospholipase/lecithinase/hemolysin